MSPAALCGMQVRKEEAVALIGVQMAPVPDQTYLRGLAAGIGKLLRRLAGVHRCMQQSQLHGGLRAMWCTKSRWFCWL